MHDMHQSDITSDGNFHCKPAGRRCEPLNATLHYMNYSDDPFFFLFSKLLCCIEAVFLTFTSCCSYFGSLPVIYTSFAFLQ